MMRDLKVKSKKKKVIKIRHILDTPHKFFKTSSTFPNIFNISTILQLILRLIDISNYKESLLWPTYRLLPQFQCKTSKFQYRRTEIPTFTTSLKAYSRTPRRTHKQSIELKYVKTQHSNSQLLGTSKRTRIVKRMKRKRTVIIYFRLPLSRMSVKQKPKSPKETCRSNKKKKQNSPHPGRKWYIRIPRYSTNLKPQRIKQKFQNP